MLAKRILLVFCFLVVSLPVSADEGFSENQVVATYFHRDLRCQTCLDIENLARYAIEMERAEAVEDGRLAWRSVNFEEEGNAHFAEEFELEGPTLVVALVEDGKTVRRAHLEKTWDLYGETEAFDAYVLGVVDEFLASVDSPSE